MLNLASKVVAFTLCQVPNMINFETRNITPWNLRYHYADFDITIIIILSSIFNSLKASHDLRWMCLEQLSYETLLQIFPNRVSYVVSKLL